MAVTIDGTNGITSPDFEPSSSTTPTNGLFLPAANAVGFATNSSERMRLTSAGNLGIGISSPDGKLHTYESNGVNYFESPGISSIALQFKTNGTNRYRIGIPSADTALAFYANGTTETMRLDSSGNLGLGVTPSGNSLTQSFELPSGVTLFGFSNTAYLTANSYYNGGWKYKASAAAGRFEVADAFKWFTAPSGTAGNAISFTQAMTLDASGNLGVGTTTPGAVLHIKGSNGFFAQFLNSTGNTGEGVVIGSGSGLGRISSNGASTALTLEINGTERARIDSSGNLLVGTTSQYGSAKVSVNGFVASSATGGGVFYTNTTFNEEVAFSSAKSILGGAYVATDACIYTGKSTSKIYAMAYTQGVYLNTSGTSWTAASDERLKTDLKPIENAAQKVSTLRAVTGRFKTDEQGVSRSFLIAQDVQAVLPEAVDASDPDKLGVQYTDTIPLLVAAIKELTARLEALENK